MSLLKRSNNSIRAIRKKNAFDHRRLQLYKYWSMITIKRQFPEFPLWLSGNESDEYSWGHRFDSWPHSSGLRIWCCCGVWYRLAATAAIHPLGWEPPYSEGAALNTHTHSHTHTHTHTSHSQIMFKRWVVHSAFLVMYPPSFNIPLNI